MFRGLFKMHDNCSECGISFQPSESDGGFYHGSIYFNYGLTAIIIAIGYPILMFESGLSENVLLGLATAFCVFFPMLFHRNSRALWFGFDQLWDPRDGEIGTGREEEKK